MFAEAGICVHPSGMSGEAEQFTTQFGANTTQYYVGVAVFAMENSSLAYARLLNGHIIFLSGGSKEGV